MRAHGKILDFVPFDFRTPSLKRARKRLCNVRDECFLVPVVSGSGRTLNLGNAPRHPLQALLITPLVVWYWRAGRRG